MADTAVPNYVPGPIVTLVQYAAGVIGISPAIVAAQWRVESDFNDNALSSTGARGLTQIEPQTWQGANCSGNPDNANDSAKCYSKIMYSLVKQYHGDIRDALAAYNAGSGDISAGYGYADQILAAANAGTDPKASKGTGPGDQPSAGSQSGCNIPDCAWGCVPNVTILGAEVWQGQCLVTYKQAREVLGAVMLAGGLLVMGWGAQLLVGVAAMGVASKVVTPVVSRFMGAQRTVKQVQSLGS